ncbi:MAG: CPBP family glutamic-type intramembrane protease, partial [Phycisphaerales bacterium]
MASGTTTPRAPSTRSLRTGGTSSPRPAPASDRIPLGERRYAWISRRPLHVLVFLLPLILAYEVGGAVFLLGEGGGGETIRAHEDVARVLGAFGATGVFLPGVLLVAVLLAWHALSKDPWRIRPRVLGGMAVESALWTLPLLVLGVMAQRVSQESLVAAAATGGGTGVESAPAFTKLTLAIGAGLYEELLFRLVGIAAIHFVLVDLLRMKNGPGTGIAVVLSAVAFALYHDASFFDGVSRPAVGGVAAARFVFLTLAGVGLG